MACLLGLETCERDETLGYYHTSLGSRALDAIKTFKINKHILTISLNGKRNSSNY